MGLNALIATVRTRFIQGLKALRIYYESGSSEASILPCSLRLPSHSTPHPGSLATAYGRLFTLEETTYPYASANNRQVVEVWCPDSIRSPIARRCPIRGGASHELHSFCLHTEIPSWWLLGCGYRLLSRFVTDSMSLPLLLISIRDYLFEIFINANSPGHTTTTVNLCIPHTLRTKFGMYNLLSPMPLEDGFGRDKQCKQSRSSTPIAYTTNLNTSLIGDDISGTRDLRLAFQFVGHSGEALQRS